MAKLGSLQISDASVAGYDGRSGFVIELFSYWNGSEPTWAIPDWEERSMAELEGPFATRAEAESALAKAGA